jgi:hypothetical protein
MVHTRRDVVIGVIAAAGSAAAAVVWGKTAAIPLFGICGILTLWLIWDIYRPRWVQWRSSKRDSGYRKITGGYSTDRGDFIRYKDGEDVVIPRPRGAQGIGQGVNPTVTTSSGRWNQMRQRFGQWITPR